MTEAHMKQQNLLAQLQDEESFSLSYQYCFL